MAADDEARLSRIKTLWTQMLASGTGTDRGPGSQVARYYRPAYRYLLGMLRDAAEAEELAQEFAVRFLRGDFQGADPQRGRFRDFLKTALRNQVRDYWRKNQRRAPEGPLPDDLADNNSHPAADDEAFLTHWREGLLDRAWQLLSSQEQSTGRPYHTVLRWKTREPTLRSEEIAERLARESGHDYTPEAARQMLHRAREHFADFLLDETLSSLPTPDLDLAAEELQELKLWDYCRKALERRRA